MDEKNSYKGSTRIGDFHRDEGRDSFHNRRRQADWVVRAAAILSLISWLVAFGALLIIEFAAPERSNLFTNIWDGEVRTTWEVGMLPVAFGLLIFAVMACVVAFAFNAMRMRRKTDKYRKSIIIIGIATIIGLVVFTIRFAEFLF